MRKKNHWKYFSIIKCVDTCKKQTFSTSNIFFKKHPNLSSESSRVYKWGHWTVDWSPDGWFHVLVEVFTLFWFGLKHIQGIFFTVKSIKMLCKFESCFQFFFFSCILFCYTFNQLLGNYLKLNAQIRLINSSV